MPPALVQKNKTILPERKENKTETKTTISCRKAFFRWCPRRKQKKTKTTINLCGLGWSRVPKLMFFERITKEKQKQQSTEE